MNVTSSYPQWLNEAAEAARRRGEHGVANTCQQAALHIARLELNAQWIPVEERLPESGYVVGMSRGIIAWGADVLPAKTFNRKLDIYTHWCPLPEPPGSAVGPDAVSVPRPDEQNAVDERPAEELVPRGAQ